MLARELKPSFALYSFFGLHMNFYKSEVNFMQHFSFLGLCWDMVNMSVSLSSDKHWEPAVGWCLVTEATHYSLSGYVLFGQDHLLYQWTCRTFPIVLCYSQWHIECLPFSCTFISFFSLFCSTTVSAPEAQLQQSLVPLWFPLPDVVITTDAHHLTYFWHSCVLISCCGTWSGSMSKIHVVLQELQAVALMLHKMTFQLSSKVAALHLDNISTKVLCM